MKKTHLRNLFAFAAFSLLFASCQKNTDVEQAELAVPQSVLESIAGLGFSTKDVVRHEEGYLVEGDIVITEGDLRRNMQVNFLRVGEEEQYRTTNLVRNLPRTITVSIASNLPSSYRTALDEALARFNALDLQIRFTRVSRSAQIAITRGNGNYLASAGFPFSSGQPYNSIRVNSSAIGNQPLATVATILAHEIGHCIGFRHTDYMNRSYSCGGSAVNEGASTVGAIHIPGTPTGPDPNSWMLSCIGSGQNRPFNANDRTALAYIY